MADTTPLLREIIRRRLSSPAYENACKIPPQLLVISPLAEFPLPQQARIKRLRGGAWRPVGGMTGL